MVAADHAEAEHCAAEHGGRVAAPPARRADRLSGRLGPVHRAVRVLPVSAVIPHPRRTAALPPVVAAAVYGVRRARAERRELRIDRRTWALGVVALGTTVAVGAGELARVWHRGSAPLPTETTDVVGATGEAVRETVEVARAGYRGGSTRENALLNLLGSFTLTFGIARGLTHMIRRRGRFGPIRDYRFGGRHVHHFVPGILLAFIAGGVSVVSRSPDLDPWLALPFGAASR